MIGDTWYRFQEQRYASEDELSLYPRTVVRVEKYQVVKETRCGVWLRTPWQKDRFVLSGARKKFACPTMKAAKSSFMARKKKQLRILRSKIKFVREAIQAAKYCSESNSKVIWK